MPEGPSPPLPPPSTQTLLAEAHTRLARLAKDKAKYKALLTELLIQVKPSGRLHPFLWLPLLCVLQQPRSPCR